MRVSTKGRYALRMLLDFSLHDAEGPVSLRDVSQRQGISVKYLEQIIMLLCRSGLVKSMRGPQGGYRLAMPPEEITAGMVLRITEGSLAPVACLDKGGNCARMERCATVELWRRLDEAIGGVVDHFTLAELAGIQQKKPPENAETEIKPLTKA